MVQIGELNFKAKFDGTALTRGLMSSRQQMAFARKEMEDLKTPAQRYADSIDNVNKLIAKYPALEANRTKYMREATRAYLEQSEAVRKLTRDEQRRLDLMRGGPGPKAAEIPKAGFLATATNLSPVALGAAGVASAVGGSLVKAADSQRTENLLASMTQSRQSGQRPHDRSARTQQG